VLPLYVMCDCGLGSSYELEEKMAATDRCARASLSACCKFHVIVPCVILTSRRVSRSFLSVPPDGSTA
jgi:hypothetical protein